MSDVVYVKSISEDGTEVYNEVAVEAVVKDHSLYKGVVAESIHRREELKKLKSAEPVVEQPSAPVEQPPVVDPAKLADEIRAKVLNDIATQEQSKRDAENALNALIVKHGLTEADREALRLSSNPEATAEFISRRLKSFAPATKPGVPSDPAGAKDFSDRVLKRMFPES